MAHRDDEQDQADSIGEEAAHQRCGDVTDRWYSLSRMSRSNEIISMLTAGCSVLRVMLPLFIVGLLTACFSMALNYSLAPHSDQMRKTLLNQINKGHEKSDELDQQLYRNRQDSRTWYVESIQKKQNLLNGVDLTQQDAKGNIVTKWYVDRALFHPEDKSWTFTRGKQVNFDRDGNILNEDDSWLRGSKRITGWSETIWRIVSTNDDPQDLSVKELKEYIANNADFKEARLAPFRTHYWYRWAVPFQCLVVIFIAAPLVSSFHAAACSQASQVAFSYSSRWASSISCSSHWAKATDPVDRRGLEFKCHISPRRLLSALASSQ